MRGFDISPPGPHKRQVEITLEISDLSRSGAGIGRDASGRALFVPFTAPGDKVRVEVVAEEKRYAEGKIVELIEASPARSTPPCPVFTQCGGCEWQHIPYERQWAAKAGGVRHSLARVGVNAENLPWSDLPAERIWEYRNRVQVRGFRNEIGFYARRSKTIVPIEKCWIARPELNERLSEVREAGKNAAREYKVELEVFPDGRVSTLWNQRHSASGFRQVHDEQNAKLQAWVAEELSEGGHLLDLFGGNGNLSLGLACRFEAISCVDFGAPFSLPNQPAHFSFHASDVTAWLKRMQRPLQEAAIPLQIILDPPREGLGENLHTIVEILHSLPATTILLIGCEPDPWARAVHRFQRAGWAPEKIGALDFFPQTHHVEALAVLRRQTPLMPQKPAP